MRTEVISRIFSLLKVKKVFKSGKRDSNPRPSVWETDALPAELFPHVNINITHQT